MSVVPFFKRVSKYVWAYVEPFHHSQPRVDAKVFPKKETAKTWSTVSKSPIIVPVLHITEEWKTTNLHEFMPDSSINAPGMWGVLRGIKQKEEEGTDEELEIFTPVDLLLIGTYDETCAFRNYSRFCKDNFTHASPYLTDHHVVSIDDGDALENFLS